MLSTVPVILSTIPGDVVQHSGIPEKVDNFRMESVANFDWNGWTTSNGTLDNFKWNEWPTSSGARNFTEFASIRLAIGASVAHIEVGHGNGDLINLCEVIYGLRISNILLSTDDIYNGRV